MNKIILAIAVALITIPTLLSAPAEAGGKRKMHRHFHHMLTMKRHKHIRDQQHDYLAAKKRKARIIAAKKAAARKAAIQRAAAQKAAAVKAARLAQAEAAQAEAATVETAAPAEVAVSENSSIATSSNKVAAVADTKDEAPEKVASTSDVGCKKFFASVGMTLTVPCE
jgi:hypothetical protein